MYPDFSKPFDRIICHRAKDQLPLFHARLCDEEHLGANVKELLAIVWVLKSLGNSLYGVQNRTIYTDHKPLAAAVSPKNTNDKIIR